MRIHILVITGAMTAPLALALQKQGHTVTGSDQDKTYPPFSTQLKEANIPVNQTEINQDIDLCIIGSGYRNFIRTSQEFNRVKELNIPYISATEYLAQNLIKSESILVAGSYGKTTISALMSYLMPDTNYFFGGLSANKLASLQFSNSNWSVVEADESINGLDTQAKFLYYPVKYLIITSANWEHKESYPTEISNQQAYIKLLQQVPSDGLIVYNQNDPDLVKIIQNASAPKLPYENFEFDTPLIGQHNHQNICAAITMIKALNLDLQKAINLIPKFLGVKRRLQVISKSHDIVIIDDYAQSANRVEVAINSVESSFPKANIKVFFEPHASFLQTPSSLKGFKKAFSGCSEVILSQISYHKSIKGERVTARTYTEEIGESLKYIPLYEDIFQYLSNTLKPGDVLVHFSSGGLDGLATLKRLVSQINPEVSYT